MTQLIQFLSIFRSLFTITRLAAGVLQALRDGLQNWSAHISRGGTPESQRETKTKKSKVDRCVGAKEYFWLNFNFINCRTCTRK